MDFYIHDSAGVWVDMIEEPTSAIWTRRYNKPGDFEIYTPATVELFSLLLPGRFVVNQSGGTVTLTPTETVRYITRPDSDRVMLVERLELTTDEENGDFIKITGREAGCLMERRIVWQQTTLAGRVDRAIYKLINENAINPIDPARALPLSMAIPNVLTSTFSAQHTGTNLLEAVETTCAAHGLGFRVVTNDKSVISMRVELYAGKDRRAGQAVNAPVIFSPNFENLISSHYAFDMAKYKNVALVAGEGEGVARKRATYGEASGLARRELYVDARDMSTNEGEISASEYTAQLEARGAEKLSEAQAAEAFGGEVDTAHTFILDVDYTIGDIVTVENEYGIRADARIAAVTEYWDANGYATDCTFEGMEG